jgi:hypothetical protein
MQPWVIVETASYVGSLLGEKWDTDPELRTIMHRFDLAILCALAIGIGWLIWHRLRDRSRLN